MTLTDRRVYRDSWNRHIDQLPTIALGFKGKKRRNALREINGIKRKLKDIVKSASKEICGHSGDNCKCVDCKE